MRIAVGSYQASDGQFIPVHSVAVTVATLTARGRASLRAAFPFWQEAQQHFGEIVGQKFTQELSSLTDMLTTRSLSGSVYVHKKRSLH